MADLWRGNPGGSNEVDKVRDASDIVRIVGEHLSLKPKGREYVCLCPFHNDHNPSMRVVPNKQIFHCFVCGTGGNVFNFVMKFHKMEFREALEFLAEKAGITLAPRGRRAEESAGPDYVSRRDLLDACDAASSFFQQTLAHPQRGALARSAVSRRGISPEIVEQFRLGAAPEGWDGFVTAALTKGLRLPVLVQAGLVKKRENSDGGYDLLRNRLIFPIHDKAGRVVAFGGRKLLEEDEPKYLNSPETPLFKKAATLYALHAAARTIQAEKTVLVTEGYMDALACHQAGFANAVATLGTALTTEHAAVLRPLCDTVVLLFDGDDAGQRAADRAVSVFFAEPIDVRIATLAAYTDAKDPDELLKRENGHDVFKRVLAGAVDLLEYRFSRVRAGLRGAGVAAVSKAILSEIDSLVDMGLRDVEPVRQKLIVKRLAQLGGIDEATVLRALPAGRRPRSPLNAGPGPLPATVGPDSPQVRAEPPVMLNFATAPLTPAQHMLGCLLCDGSLWNAMGEREKDVIAPVGFELEPIRMVAQLVLDAGEDGRVPDLAAVLRSNPDESTSSAAVGLAGRIEMETESDRDRLHAHWRACVTRALLDRQSESHRIQRVEIKQDPGATDAGSAVVQRLLEKRQSHAALGADRRVLPRPN